MKSLRDLEVRRQKSEDRRQNERLAPQSCGRCLPYFIAATVKVKGRMLPTVEVTGQLCHRRLSDCLTCE